jgi:nitrile hydratase accessory protein
LADAVQGIPRDEAGPVFREPWEAQAFAIAATLMQRGMFSAGEWSAALGREIKRAQAAGDPDTGGTYYRHWLAALEQMVVQKGLATQAALVKSREAWEAAARRTPHGKPIEL